MIRVVDLFAGAGGSSLGAHMAGCRGRDLSTILPDLTLERMGMVLAMELQATLPPGLLLFSLELDHGPNRITVIPSLGEGSGTNEG